MNETCKHCGGDYAIHHFETNQCPVGGVEPPLGKPNRWQSSTFEPLATTLEVVKDDNWLRLESETIFDTATGIYYTFNSRAVDRKHVFVATRETAEENGWLEPRLEINSVHNASETSAMVIYGADAQRAWEKLLAKCD